MTFATIQSRIADRLNLTSTSALTRIGNSINEKYRELASDLGFATVERGISVVTNAVGSRDMTFAFPAVTLTGTTFIPTGTVMQWGGLATVLVPTLGSLIAFDAAKAGGQLSNVSTLTVSHTIGGSANFLIVGVLGDATNDLVTGATAVQWNGTNMTLIGKALVGTNWMYLFALAAPTTGTHNVVITATGVCSVLGCEIASYTNVSSIYYQQIVSLGGGSSTISATGSFSITVGPPVVNSWALAFLHNNSGNALYSASSLGGGTSSNIRTNESTGALIDSGVIAGGVQKILALYNTAYTPPLVLSEVSYDQIENEPAVSDPPVEYALKTTTANSVTLKINSLSTSSFTLTADVLVNLQDLSGTALPAFQEDYHDILIYGGMQIELEKMEKYALAKKQSDQYDKRVAQLRYYIQKSAYLDIVQGQNQQLTVSRNVPLV